MKLLTHNFLTSNIVKGVTNGYPLGLKVSKIEIKKQDYNPEFIQRMIPKLDWTAVLKAAKDVGYEQELVDKVPENFTEDENFLKTAHNALLEVEVIEGKLVCPESGREFPIQNGIPNMLLNEDEV